MNVTTKLDNYQAGQSTMSTAPTAVRNANVQKVASNVSELTKGQVFEGNISNIKGSQVTIKLVNGSTLRANIDQRSGISLKEGQSMFFQVKSNDGQTIAIRPFTVNGNPMNPILYQALQSAGLSTNGDYIKMVDQMMQEGLSIDRNSLTQMARVIAGNSGSDVQTLVQMSKLGLTIDEANITQFTNYKNNENSLLNTMSEITDGLGTWISENEGAAELISANKMLVALLGKGTEGNVISSAQSQTATNWVPGAIEPGTVTPQGEINTLSPEDEQLFAELGKQSQAPDPGIGSLLSEKAITSLNDKLISLLSNSEGGLNTGLFKLETTTNENGTFQSASLNSELTPKEFMQELESFLNTIDLSGKTTNILTQSSGLSQTAIAALESGILGEDALRFAASGSLTEEQTALLNAAAEELTKSGGQDAASFAEKARNILGQMLSEYTESSVLEEGLSESVSAKLKDLFTGKEFQNIMKEAFLNKWTLTPESVGKDGTIDKFYKELATEMERLSQAFKDAASPALNNAVKAANSTLDNISMMYEINQIYNYVQIPLSLSGQKANGELFVYTNKKSLANHEGDLSCMLHLDLEHLGTTDIYVKMRGRDVNAQFTMSDDISFNLMKNNIGKLNDRLVKLGYKVELSVDNNVKEQDFVKDFLMREDRGDTLKRYSFDVKA